ncbi:polysaccharide deacetylase family protein [Deinococcus navajonensis]|uniref:Polysaccharide deacetylase family protein n=1 Tax=Deinococcus navajonensis TaxID=309884 RepID=A0ABV8XPG8_9DEIO
MAPELRWLKGLRWPAGLLLAGILAGELLGRAAGWGALGGGPPEGNRVALTFDDGPSERTAELLSVLARHQVQATFFVTAPAVEAFPEALAALRAAGHQIEAHGRWHTHALLLPPWQESAQLRWHPRETEAGPHLYRPPYGGHSPLTRLLARLQDRQIALWDVEGRDWTAGEPGTLAAQTLAQVQPGSVVLLHDGPAVTPALLDELLSGFQVRGLQAVTLNHLPPRRIGLGAGLRRLRTSYGL